MSISMRLDDGGSVGPAPAAAPAPEAPAEPAASPISIQADDHKAALEAAEAAKAEPAPAPTEPAPAAPVPAGAAPEPPAADPAAAAPAAAAEPVAPADPAAAAPAPAPAHVSPAAADAADAKAVAEAASPPAAKPSPALTEVLKSEQEVADRLAHDQAIDAKTIDAALTPERRAELQQQQDEFLGTKQLNQADIDRQLLVQVQAWKAQADAEAHAKSEPGISASAGGPDPGASAPAVDPTTPKPAESGAKEEEEPRPGESKRTQQEVAAYLVTRDYWIDDNGTAWKVLADAHGGASLERSNDETGSLTDDPISTRSRATEAGVDSSPDHVRGLAASSGAYTNAELDDLFGPERSPIAGGTGVAGEAPAPVSAPAPVPVLPAGPVAPSSFPSILEDTPPVHRTASAAIHYSADGSSIAESTNTTRTDAGVELTQSSRATHDAEYVQTGLSSVENLRSSTPDGGTATVLRHRAFGTLDNKDSLGKSFVKVTITDAAGTLVRSTDTDHPAPAPEPTTLDELRASQDRLGAMAARAKLPDGADPFTPDEYRTPGDLLAAATRQADSIDLEALQNATSIGTMKLAGTYDAYKLQREERLKAFGLGPAPSVGSSYISGTASGSLDPDSVSFLERKVDPVIKYGNDTFRGVREQLAAMGIDAAEGNADIGKNWRDASLVDNAFYTSDGDAMDFGLWDKTMPFAMSDDVIAHEFTHRIVWQQAPGLKYEGQTGAVNESLADTMGAAVDGEDWLIGENTVEGGVRDMSRPVTMSDYLKTTEDQGGVHTNSAIPNHAAYLIGKAVGRDDMGRIYAQTITEHLDDNTDFEALANGTWRSATELYGAGSAQVQAVRDAWDSVLQLYGDDRLWSTDPDYDAAPRLGSQPRSDGAPPQSPKGVSPG